MHTFYVWAHGQRLVASVPTSPLRRGAHHGAADEKEVTPQKAERTTNPWPELGPLALRYVAERERRKEIGKTAARSAHYTLTTLVRVVGWEKDTRKLRRADIERWQERRDLAPATMRNQLSVVRGFCAWLVRNGYAKKDPTLDIPNPRQPRYLPRGLPAADVGQVLSECPDVRSHLILTLMVQQGLRCAEVAALQIGDIDFDERVMVVRGKGGHQRPLPITEETWTAMGRYLAEYPARHGPLVRSYRRPTRGLKAKYLSQSVAKWMHGAGLAATGHSLRHSCATDMLRAGAHVRDVQQALGHASLQTTQAYLPWVVNDLREAMGSRRYRR